MVRVLILKSGAPHQSEAPSSEFRGGKSSDLKIRGEGKGGGGEGGRGGRGGGARTDTPIHRHTVPSSLPRSAYRRICLLDRRIGVFAPGSAYRRISCPDRRTGVSAYRRISCPDRRIGVCAPSGPCAGVSAYRRKAVLRHYLQARWVL